MTNTKFRRRALVSSLAMLLVALVALGSATFAWFTSNPKADAYGIAGKGETSTGLVIQTDSDGGNTGTFTAHSAQFFKNVPAYTMSPAWHTQTVGNFIAADAKASDDADVQPSAEGAVKNWRSVTTYTASANSAFTGVYYEKAYLRTTGAGNYDSSDENSTGAQVKLAGLTIDAAAGATMSPALTVDVVANGAVVGTYKVGANAVKNYGTAANGSAVADASGTKTTTTQSATAAIATPLGRAYDDTSLVVTFYVYLDGSDPSVTTDNASAADLIGSNGIKAYFVTV